MLDLPFPPPPSLALVRFYFPARRARCCLQQGVRLIARLNRRKSRKGGRPLAESARGCEKRERERKRKGGKRVKEKGRLLSRAPPRRFQGDTNLYGGEILASSAAFPSASRRVGDVDPEIGMLGPDRRAAPEGSPRGKVSPRVNSPPPVDE